MKILGKKTKIVNQMKEMKQRFAVNMKSKLAAVRRSNLLERRWVLWKAEGEYNGEELCKS